MARITKAMRSTALASVPRRTVVDLGLALGLLGALTVVSGCAEYQVRIADSDPLENQKYHEETVHHLLWGISVSPEVVEADCPGLDPSEHAINDVIIKSNYFYDLVSVLTLGIWMPIDVEYRCKAPCPDGC